MSLNICLWSFSRNWLQNFWSFIPIIWALISFRVFRWSFFVYHDDLLSRRKVFFLFFGIIFPIKIRITFKILDLLFLKIYNIKIIGYLRLDCKEMIGVSIGKLIQSNMNDYSSFELIFWVANWMRPTTCMNYKAAIKKITHHNNLLILSVLFSFQVVEAVFNLLFIGVPFESAAFDNHIDNIFRNQV